MAPCTLEDLDNFVKTIHNAIFINYDGESKYRQFNVDFKTHITVFEIRQVSSSYEVKLNGITNKNVINPLRYAFDRYEITPCELSRLLIKLSTVCDYDILEIELKSILASMHANIIEFKDVIRSLNNKGISYNDITVNDFPEVEFVENGMNTKIKLIDSNFIVKHYHINKTKPVPTNCKDPIKYVKDNI